MPVRGKMELKGLGEWLEAIVKAGNDVDAAVAEALNESAEFVLSDMLLRVPIGEGYPSAGYLRDHLRIWGPGKVGNYHWVFVGLDMSDRKAALHGVFVEYGTVHMAAHPYMRPAFDENRKFIKSLLADILKGFIP